MKCCFCDKKVVIKKNKRGDRIYECACNKLIVKKDYQKARDK